MAPQDKNPAAVNPSSLPLPTDTQHLLSQPPGAPPGFLPQEALNPFTVNPLELSLLYQKAGVKPKGLTIFPPTEMTLPCQRVLATAPHVQNQNTALQSAPQLPRDIPTAYPVLVKLEYVKQMYHMKLGIEDLYKGLRAWSDSYKKFNPSVDMKSLSYDWDRRFKNYIVQPLYAIALPFLELMYLRSSPTTPKLPFLLLTLLNKDLSLVNLSPMPVLMATAHIIFAMLAKYGFEKVVYHLMGHGPKDLDAEQKLKAKNRSLTVYHKVASEIYKSLAMYWRQNVESKRFDLQNLINIWSNGFEHRERELNAMAMEKRDWQMASFLDIDEEEPIATKREMEEKERAAVRNYFRYWCNDLGVTLKDDVNNPVVQTHPGNGPAPPALPQTTVHNQQQAQFQAEFHAHFQALLPPHLRAQLQARVQAQQQAQQQFQQNNGQSDTNMQDAPPTNGQPAISPALTESQPMSQTTSQSANTSHSSSYQSQPYQSPPTPPGDQHPIQLPQGQRPTPDAEAMPPPRLPPYSRPCMTFEEERRVTAFLTTWGRGGKLWKGEHGARPKEPVPAFGEVWIDRFSMVDLAGFRWL